MMRIQDPSKTNGQGISQNSTLEMEKGAEAESSKGGKTIYLKVGGVNEKIEEVWKSLEEAYAKGHKTHNQKRLMSANVFFQ